MILGRQSTQGENCGLRKFIGQGKTKTTGGKANESDEYIITNTPEATTSFPRGALLWKKFGAWCSLNFL